jgi:hypothetical protein
MAQTYLVLERLLRQPLLLRERLLLLHRQVVRRLGRGGLAGRRRHDVPVLRERERERERERARGFKSGCRERAPRARSTARETA